MQVKKKPRNAATKKNQKAPPKETRTKKEQTEQPFLKRMIFGEERPDLTELEAGSTTILDILAPTTVDTKSKDYIVVDGVYHTYLYITGYGITNGTGADTFSPDTPVTVRQWSVMLCRAYGLPIEGDTWEEMSYVAMVEAYSHGWMYSSIFSAPETQMCRGALYDSAFAATGIPIYDNTLYDREALSAYENTLRIAGEFQLCDSGSNPQKIVTRAETARLLHAILTRDLTVEAPTVPVKLKNPTDINANDFLLELQKVPEAILAEFNQRGWAYSMTLIALQSTTGHEN